MGQKKKIAKPAWWKNTYFWISGILFILFIIGIVDGNAAIRDPGQRRESTPLWLLYLVASAVMLLNGYFSHAQTVQHYKETSEGTATE